MVMQRLYLQVLHDCLLLLHFPCVLTTGVRVNFGHIIPSRMPFSQLPNIVSSIP